MSRSSAADTLPPSARSIALLLASTPTVQDAQPGVLHQLLEFSHRYTSQVLSDALMYAEHAGHSGKVEMDDIILAVQARVGWEFGGRVPKEYILSLANQTNAIPLPSVPEVFGVRLPQPSDCLTSIDFNLVPNKPPPNEKLYDEEIEEVDESEDDEDMEPAPIPSSAPNNIYGYSQAAGEGGPTPPPPPPPSMGVAHTASFGSILGAQDDVSEAEEEDGLFAGGDDDDESGDDAMDVTQDSAANGIKRKLVEEDDYD